MGFTECTPCRMEGEVIGVTYPKVILVTELESRVAQLEAKVLELERRTIGSMLVGGYQG